MVLGVGLISLTWGMAFAQTQPLFAPENPSLGRKARNLGMGNTGASLYGTHDSAAMYNPAGLNDLEKGEFRFFTNTFEAAADSIGLITDVKDLVSDIDDAANDAAKTRVFNRFLQARTGEFQRIRFALELISYARKDFAAGLIIDERLDLSFRDQSFPHFNVRNMGDVALYFAASHGFWDKLLQVGVTVKPTVRFSLDEADQQITFGDVIGEDANGDSLIETKFKKIYEERRFGLGIDVGLKSDLSFPLVKKYFPLYDYLKPQIGFTWQDLGNPGFGGGVRNEQSISTGIAVHPDIWKLKNTVALEFRNLNQDRPFVSMLHFGLEVEFPWILAVRAGVSQGYVTGGLSVDLWFAELVGAVYYEEIGYRTREKGSLRYTGSLAFKI